jgi:hypothetical protein
MRAGGQSRRHGRKVEGQNIEVGSTCCRKRQEQLECSTRELGLLKCIADLHETVSLVSEN